MPVRRVGPLTTRRHDLRVAGVKMRLHGLERCFVDEWRHVGCHDLAGRLGSFGGATPVEFVLPDIGRSGEYTMQLPDAPARAVAGKDAMLVQVGGDVLDAHWAGCAVPFQGQPVNQPHRVGVQRIDFQLLLDLRATLLRRHDPVADRRAGAVPKTLAGIFFHGPQRVFAVLFGLILVEQRHHLAHHDVHRVVADLLGDRDQSDAVLGKFAHIEFEFEVVAEEAAEGVDDHDIERRGLGGAGFNHPLEFRAPIVGG